MRVDIPGRRRMLIALPLAPWGLAPPSAAQTATAGFDHRHGAWDALLRQHVVLSPGGNASTLRYAALRAGRSALEAYLDTLSAVSAATYAAWSRPQQLAFLINAYNAFTVDLILARYPDLESIKDLGSFLQSPWKKKFFQLLGQARSLDEVEHGMIRAPGAFDDPRIHVAVVCASIGCPMLRNEAYTAERLDAQLDDALATTVQAQADIRAGRYKLSFLDYDWALNDAR
jgi:hypothetical protein